MTFFTIVLVLVDKIFLSITIFLTLGLFLIFFTSQTFAQDDSIEFPMDNLNKENRNISINKLTENNHNNQTNYQSHEDIILGIGFEYPTTWKVRYASGDNNILLLIPPDREYVDEQVEI